MSLDPRARFSQTVTDYARFRPSYPAALVPLILQHAPVPPGGTIVDLGAGTGLSTRLFAGRGYEVIGVEPNAAMRAEAETEALPDVRFVAGEARATGLVAGSAALVVSGQAFHWFSLDETLPELRRILVPGGRLAVFWNLRDDRQPFMREYQALLQTVGEYAKVPQGGATIAALDLRPELRPVWAEDLPHQQAFDEAGLLGRARSSSYVAHASAAEQERLFGALSLLFARYAEQGLVRFEYRTALRIYDSREASGAA